MTQPLTYDDVPGAPDLLWGTSISPDAVTQLQEHFSNWMEGYRWMTEQPNRIDIAKAALLVELHGKRRKYLCDRLLSNITRDDANLAKQQLNNFFKRR